jgi:hypothetical protein
VYSPVPASSVRSWTMRAAGDGAVPVSIVTRQ